MASGEGKEREREARWEVPCSRKQAGRLVVVGAASPYGWAWTEKRRCLIFWFLFCVCFLKSDPCESLDLLYHSIQRDSIPTCTLSELSFTKTRRFPSEFKESRVILRAMLAIFQQLFQSNKLSQPRLQWNQGSPARILAWIAAQRRDQKEVKRGQQGEGGAGCCDEEWHLVDCLRA